MGVVGRVSGHGLGDRDSIPGQVIRKTQKMVLDATLHNTQHFKVHINGKVEQFREISCPVPCNSMLKQLKKEHSGHPGLR